VTSQRCIPLEAPAEWKEALNGIRHAFPHTWENCYAMHLSTGFATYLYCFEAEGVRIVCPIAEREFDGHIDIVTPYGFSGFVGNENYPSFPRYWREFAANRHYVCGYIGLNPLFENKTYLQADELYSYKNIYVLDLGLSHDELFSRLSTNRKRQLKRCKETSEKLVLDKNSLTKFFLDNYSEFFDRKGAAPVYDFSAVTFESLFALNNVVMVGAGRPERIEASTVFAYSPHVADFLFNISLPEGRPYSAALLWYGVNYFKSIGVPLLNLGGGVRTNDSLAEFKERFGGIRLALSCLKQVYNPRVYAELCARTGADPKDRLGYFPAYRSREYCHSTA
jgi:hypothetical protein